MSKIHYKTECLKIKADLKASRVRDCAFYHIITGSQRMHKAYSKYCDTPTEAWKDCYERLIDKPVTV